MGQDKRVGKITGCTLCTNETTREHRGSAHAAPDCSPAGSLMANHVAPRFHGNSCCPTRFHGSAPTRAKFSSTNANVWTVNGACREEKKIVADRTRARRVSGPGDVGRWSTENQKGPDCPTRAGLGLPPLSVPPDSGDAQTQMHGLILGTE